MKLALLIITVLMAIMSVMSYRAPVANPRPGQPTFPTFPGTGPFIPKIPKGPWGRPSLSVNDTLTGLKNVYQRNISFNSSMQSPPISTTCSKQMYPILYISSLHGRASLRDPIVYYFSTFYINSQIEQIYEPEIIN
ncbi:hypothetical protein HZH68_005275 [Vespula germanica]|uniref:Uncharacterized protein n=1 Tax=Vespula germanica TaxID=30212 RepID=A0A834KFP5_VESGE|nr:hypothetical protein HZH68_005275 [Vespula germanica]